VNISFTDESGSEALAGELLTSAQSGDMTRNARVISDSSLASRSIPDIAEGPEAYRSPATGIASRKFVEPGS